MADEEENVESVEGASEEKKGGLFSSPIILGVAGVVLIGLGVGIAYFVFGGKSETAPVAEAAEEQPAEGEHAEPAAPPKEDAHGGAAKKEGHGAKKEAAEAEDEGHGGGGGEHGEGGENPLMVKFEPMVMSLIDRSSIHYLKLQIYAKCNNELVSAEIDAKKPLIKDKMLSIFSDVSLREILSAGGKELLKQDILAAINKFLKQGKVTHLYFTEFTVQ